MCNIYANGAPLVVLLNLSGSLKDITVADSAVKCYCFSSRTVTSVRDWIFNQESNHLLLTKTLIQVINNPRYKYFSLIS